MSQDTPKYKKDSPEANLAIRNCRIVWLHNEAPERYTFQTLGSMFGMTRQATHEIYTKWKNRPEVEKLVIVNCNGEEESIL